MSSMARFTPSLFLFSALAIGACAPVSAQTAPKTHPGRVKEIPAPLSIDAVAAGHVKELPGPLDVDEVEARHVKLVPATNSFPKAPFAIDNHGAGGTPSVHILSEDQMTRADRDLLADAESSIQERAGFQNMEFEGAGWSFHELLCPALPNHMFLRFTRDDGTRQMSMFSAAIPRDGNGRVHIIPIVRKGYSLFSPAPIGAMTIAAFNRIRTEEGAGASTDWLGTGLCYAALAGANPQVGGIAGKENETPSVFPPTLVITAQGGEMIRFADMSPRPMQWELIFTPNGKLLKANHSSAYVEHVEKTRD